MAVFVKPSRPLARLVLQLQSKDVAPQKIKKLEIIPQSDEVISKLKKALDPDAPFSSISFGATFKQISKKQDNAVVANGIF